MKQQNELSYYHLLVWQVFDSFILRRIMDKRLINKGIYYKKMGVREDTLRLSLFFFLLFTPFTSYMTILTHIYQDAGLPGIGPATLASNYIAFILSTLLAPLLKWPLKRQLLIGGICYTINYSSGILVALTEEAWLKFVISCAGAAIAGLSGGPLWVSQGRYIHLACAKSGEEKRQGQMFGIFSTLYCLANVSAGLLTTFGLGFFDAKIYFVIISSFGALSILYCAFFIKPIDAPTAVEATASDSIMQSQSNGSLLSNPASPTKPVYSPKQMLIKVFRFFPQMKMVLPLLIVDGISLGFYSSEIPHLIFSDATKQQKNKLAGYLMLSLGAGATIGSILLGKISDKMSTLFTGRLGLILAILGCSLFAITLEVKAYELAMVTSFFWGFFLFFVEGWMYLVCARHFGGKAEAFSVNKQLHSLFYLIFQLSLLPSGNQIPLFPVVLALGAIVIPTILLIGWIPVDHLTPSRTLKDQQ